MYHSNETLHEINLAPIVRIQLIRFCISRPLIRLQLIRIVIYSTTPSSSPLCSSLQRGEILYEGAFLFLCTYIKIYEVLCENVAAQKYSSKT